MAENKSIIECVLKSKLVGVFLALWGATFILRSIADFEYYIFNWGEETMVETSTWFLYDAVAILAGVVLLVLAAKAFSSKKPQ